MSSFQDLNRTYDINKSAQKRLHEVEGLTCLSVYKSKHFYSVFINLKQDLKKYVQPRTSVMADLFTLAPSPPPPSRQHTVQLPMSSLKVPKRENFSLAFFTLSEPIWVCDLGTGTKIDVFIN